MRLSKLFIYCSSLLILLGCKVNYSFTGASISPEVKSFSVQYFPNYAPLANPNLSQELTEAIKDYFISQTSLKLVQKNGDLQFSGEIIDYKTAPKAVTRGETAALNQLTVRVKVKYINNFDEKQNFEKTFAKFEVYESSKNLSDVESELTQSINEQLVQEIFSNSVGNW